jgi:preprotein translocase subunit SecA
VKNYYKTKREKYNAVIDEIISLNRKGRPVLVGTTSVEISELLSRMLKMKGLKHNVLNAKFISVKRRLLRKQVIRHNYIPPIWQVGEQI